MKTARTGPPSIPRKRRSVSNESSRRPNAFAGPRRRDRRSASGRAGCQHLACEQDHPGTGSIARHPGSDPLTQRSRVRRPRAAGSSSSTPRRDHQRVHRRARRGVAPAHRGRRAGRHGRKMLRTSPSRASTPITGSTGPGYSPPQPSEHRPLRRCTDEPPAPVPQRRREASSADARLAGLLRT